mmetsp:Transcript_5351/g.11273  ORF Transcript_5351/g.11273 Transcript_5351/m.11273 type:complete len:276 (-) Transcript_5351:423-1250(-)
MRAHSDSTRVERALVTGHRVLVQRNRRELQHALHPRPIDALWLQIHQHQMIFRASRHQTIPHLRHRVCQRRRVLQHLLLVRLKLRALSHFQRGCEACDRMVVRSALKARKHRRVDRVFQVVHGLHARLGVRATDAFAEENHRAARPTKRLVRRRRDHVGRFERRGHHSRRNQAGNVRHVGEQVRVHRVCDSAHARIVVVARVRGRTRDENARAEQFCGRLERVVVDDARRLVEAVRHRLEEDGRGRHALLLRHEAVRQVSSVRQIQRHDPIVRLQ